MGTEPNPKPRLLVALAVAAKTLGVLIALALLAAVTVKDPQWVTDRILIPIFGRGIKPAPITPPPVPPEFERAYQSITDEQVQARIQQFAALGSRVPGYPGHAQAVAIIKDALRGLPCQVVTDVKRIGDRQEPVFTTMAMQEGADPARPYFTVEDFDVTVPVDEGGRITLLGGGPDAGRTIPLHGLWPNNARTTCLPREGLVGPLIDGGRGNLDDLRDTVDGAIALIEFDCRQRYVNLRMLGAKAVIFYAAEGPPAVAAAATAPAADTQPADSPEPWYPMNFSEAQDKMLIVPADIPRYYVEAAGAQVLRRLLAPLPPREGESAARPRPLDQRLIRLQSRMRWKTVKAQNIFVNLPGSPEEKPAQYRGQPVVPWNSQRILVSAYYDSISVVPAVAPGAENAAGAAALLETIRVLADWPERKYTLSFLFTSGHFQGLAGVSAWLDRHARKNKTRLRDIQARSEEVPFKVFIGLDLSGGNHQVAAFSEGCFTNSTFATNNFRRNALAPYGAKFADYHNEVWPALRMEKPEDRYAKARYFSAITTEKRSWQDFMITPLGLEHEAVQAVGGAAFTLATAKDARLRLDTPIDDFAHLAPYLPNVTRQAQTVAALLMKAANDVAVFPESKLELPDDAGAIQGQIVWFDRDVNFFVPKAPVSDALVTYQMPGWVDASVGGVRTMIATMTTRGEPQRDVARRLGLAGDASDVHDVYTNDQKRAGRFRFDIRRAPGDTLIEAYAFDDAGRITFAPDRGQEGNVNYPMNVPASTGVADTTEVLFPCRAISVFEIVDSRRLSALDSLSVLTPEDSEPQWWGVKFVAGQSTREGRTVPAAVVFVRPDQAVKLFMSTGLFGIKYLLTNADERLVDRPPTVGEAIRGGYPVVGPGGRPAALSAAQLEQLSLGRGYNPAESVIFDPFYKAARDMWVLDDNRIQRMAYYGIRNERLDRLHGEARTALLVARAALRESPPNYAAYVAASRQAWGLEARGYPDVKQTASDSVNGIVFYFALLLPFSFFAERLLFGFKDIRAKLGGVAGVFAAVFVVLHVVHPAFKLTTSPYVILLAFIILVLGLAVLIILMRKFGEEVQKSKRAASGLHEVDVGRLSASVAAINLGINNLRKRRVRTTLTALTLILLTFTVLSFTSVQTSLRPFVLPHRHGPLYNGGLIRERSWQALQEPKLDYVESAFGVDTYEAALEALRKQGRTELAPDELAYRRWLATVCPRAWLQAKVKGNKAFYEIHNLDNAKVVNASALIGLTPQERDLISKAFDGAAFRKLGLVQAPDAWTRKGEELVAADADGPPLWIDKRDRNVCLLPSFLAGLLGITPDQIGRVRVWMLGQTFLVKGLFDGDAFNDIKDLDGEPLTPVDFVKEAAESAQTAKEDVSIQATQPIRQFEHIDAKNCVIIPYSTARDLGGVLASIALVDFRFAGDAPPPKEQTWLNAVEHFMDRVALTVFVGDKAADSVDVYSSISRTSLGQVSNLFVPIIIAAFIVLNTMIGAVYERAREIGIYSSIGLTPRHIAALFLAESAVFATVGAVVGYLIGQSLSRGLTALGVLQGSGMVLNYSSLSAIWSTVVVMATTFLSTLYPARKAAAMAVPDVTRRWKFPEPAGDDWYFDFPFTLSGSEVPGIYSYLARVFESYGEGSVGGFLTEAVSLSAQTYARYAAGPRTAGAATAEAAGALAPVGPDLGLVYTITMKTWLAPYDLGISQSVRLDAIPTGEANIYRIAMCLHRESGDVASWRRINRGFLNVLRKRFLVWRTMTPALREEYLVEGKKLIESVK